MRLQAEFLRGCEDPATLPTEGPPEAALLGRSNVGKSSLLNSLVGDAALARVSRTPGRTRQLNLFGLRGLRAGGNDRADDLVLVDCPGYGYANVSRAVWSRWGEMIHPYLEQRSQLRLCLLLVDSMLPAQAMDLDLHAWLRLRHRHTVVVATKWDRLSGNTRVVARRRLEQAYQQPVLAFSAVTGTGGDRLRAELATAASPPTAA